MKYAIAFTFACMCGLFCAAAAGIHWGTNAAGAWAAGSILFAGWLAGLLYILDRP